MRPTSIIPSAARSCVYGGVRCPQRKRSETLGSVYYGPCKRFRKGRETSVPCVFRLRPTLRLPPQHLLGLLVRSDTGQCWIACYSSRMVS